MCVLVLIGGVPGGRFSGLVPGWPFGSWGGTGHVAAPQGSVRVSVLGSSQRKRKCFYVECSIQGLFPSLLAASKRVAVSGSILINMISINVHISKYFLKVFLMKMRIRVILAGLVSCSSFLSAALLLVSSRYRL